MQNLFRKRSRKKKDGNIRKKMCGKQRRNEKENKIKLKKKHKN